MTDTNHQYQELRNACRAYFDMAGGGGQVAQEESARRINTIAKLVGCTYSEYLVTGPA